MSNFRQSTLLVFPLPQPHSLPSIIPVQLILHLHQLTELQPSQLALLQALANIVCIRETISGNYLLLTKGLTVPSTFSPSTH